MAHHLGGQISVTLLTGFLGSGKTALLNRLVKTPGMKNAVVIINEFGEVGLDHLMVEHSADRLVLLSNGCLCCTVRADLVVTLRDLAVRRHRGEIPAFDRVIIETTGLANPAPIVQALMSDVTLVTTYSLENIVTTVDAAVGISTLTRHVEAIRQVAMADRLLITKLDLATSSGLADLRRALDALNPTASVLSAHNGDITSDVPLLFGGSALAVGRDLEDKVNNAHPYRGASESSALGEHHQGGRIHTCCITRDYPLSWEIVSEWLDSLTSRYGAQLLRVKGILNIAESPDRPLIVHAVQHLFHPPVVLDCWPDDDRRSRLIVISSELEKEAMEELLLQCEWRGRGGHSIGAGLAGAQFGRRARRSAH
jgi:G3E family GTPase